MTKLVREMDICPTTGNGHDWQPLGFVLLQGALHPTDRCEDCGAERFPFSPAILEVQP